MAESFSVKAILSARDSNFSSVMKGASSSLSGLKSTITSGLGFGILSGIGQAAFSKITGGISGVVSELGSSSAAWKTFTGNMGMLGKNSGEIQQIKGELQDFATETIYSASDMATTYSQLAAVGTKNCTKLVKGFGGLASAAENPQQAMKTLSQQATQMAAKPQVAWMDFKLMMEQTPAGIAAVARQMGKSTAELVMDVQDGKVATDEFFDAIAKVGTNDSFTKLATEYKTVGQAADGLKETISNKLAPSFDVMSSVGISAISKLVDSFDGIDGNALAAKVTSFVDKAKPYWNSFVSGVTEVKDAFGSAVSAISGSLGKLNGGFSSTDVIKSFGDALGIAKDGLVLFAGFLEKNSDTIAKVLPYLPKLLFAYMGFKAVSSVAPGVGMFTKAIVGMAGKGISGLAGKLFGIGKATDDVGKKSSASSGKILTSAKAFLMMGGAVLLISAGFALLAHSAVEIANSGGLAVGVLAGLIVAVGVFGAGMVSMINSIKPGPAKLNAIAGAMLALGGAVLLISVGFAILSNSAINLANAGPLAIATMAGMVAAVGALLLVAKSVGPSLTAGAVGFIAFGAAVVLAGAGMMLLSTAAINLANAGPLAIGVMVGLVAVIALLAVGAAALGPALIVGGVGAAILGAGLVLIAASALIAGVALNVIVAALPGLAQYGASGAVAIAQLGASMVVFGAGALVAGAGAVVLGAGLLVVGAGALVAAAGVLVLGAGTVVLGAGLTLVAATLMLASASLPMLASGATSSAAALAMLLTASTALSAVLLVIGVSALISSVGMAAFGVAVLAASVGAIALKAALATVNSSMKSIAGNAKSAENSLTSMESSIDVVGSGLDALGSKVQSAMSNLVSKFKDTEGKATSSGKNIGDNFKNSMQPGMNQVPQVASSTMSKFNSGIRSGGSSATASARSISASIAASLNSASGSSYSAGVNIGRGLLNGLNAMRGSVQAAAAALANAAAAAIRSAAQIHSPSRVADKLGQYFGTGFANGIQAMTGLVEKYSDELVAIPTLAIASGPDISLSSEKNGSLSEEYSYTSNATYTINVPVEMDGREVAKATATYTQEELEKMEHRKSRKQGNR